MLQREYIMRKREGEDDHGYAVEDTPEALSAGRASPEARYLGNWYRCFKCVEQGGEGIHLDWGDAAEGMTRPQPRTHIDIKLFGNQRRVSWLCPRCRKAHVLALKEAREAAQDRYRQEKQRNGMTEAFRGLNAPDAEEADAAFDAPPKPYERAKARR